MRTCEYDGTAFTEPRSHPWTDAASNADFRYYDLKIEPARIRTALEDFAPWSRYPAIHAFYTLLEALNSPGFPLESNDCAFTAPHANESPAMAMSLQCSGRVMVLYRALGENSREQIASLANEIHRRLGARDFEFAEGMIGTTIVPVRYVALPEGAQLGHQLLISFWAWGNDEAGLMTNLERVIVNLSAALLTREDAD